MHRHEFSILVQYKYNYANIISSPLNIQNLFLIVRIHPTHIHAALKIYVIYFLNGTYFFHQRISYNL